MINDLTTGKADSAPTARPVEYHRSVYFAADDGQDGVELWHSDGTAAGTHWATQVNLGRSASPRNLVNVGGTLIFSASDGGRGEEMWSLPADETAWLDAAPGASYALLGSSLNVAGGNVAQAASPPSPSPAPATSSKLRQRRDHTLERHDRRRDDCAGEVHVCR